MLILGLSILLAPILGVAGVALGTLIARLLGSGPVMLLQALKVIKTFSAVATDSARVRENCCSRRRNNQADFWRVCQTIILRSRSIYNAVSESVGDDLSVVRMVLEIWRCTARDYPPAVDLTADT